MASFKLTSKDGEWQLSQGANLIGCAGHCVVRVEAPNVAGEHARVDVVEDQLLLTDLDSETGTFLDDVLVRGTVPIEVGQTLRVGSKPLRLKRVPAKNGRLPRAPLRRAARVGLKVGLGALAALVVFFVVLSLIFNADRLRRDIVKGIESTVERDVEIGNVGLRFFRGRTELRDVVVPDLPEFGEEPFV
ncbi:MAG: FHA domain-containing protein, partial [Planctomycetota bacterium]